MDDKRKYLPDQKKKKSTKRNIDKNYRLVTCIPMMWKILTGKIRRRYTIC